MSPDRTTSWAFSHIRVTALEMQSTCMAFDLEAGSVLTRSHGLHRYESNSLRQLSLQSVLLRRCRQHPVLPAISHHVAPSTTSCTLSVALRVALRLASREVRGRQPPKRLCVFSGVPMPDPELRKGPCSVFIRGADRGGYDNRCPGTAG